MLLERCKIRVLLLRANLRVKVKCGERSLNFCSEDVTVSN